MIGNEISISFLYIENIGLGHALDYKVLDIYGENINLYIKENLSIIKIESESKILLEIRKPVTSKFISLLDKINNDENEKQNVLISSIVVNIPLYQIYETSTAYQVLKNDSNEKIYIDIEYSDLFTNRYKKTFCLELYFDLALCNQGSKCLLDGKVKDLSEKSKEIKL